MKTKVKIERREEKEIVTAITCDICKKEFTLIEPIPTETLWEVEEFLHIRKEGGYGSVFGDGVTIECDICQHCLKKFIDENYREIN